MAFQDHFSKQAARYTQFRPRYPRALFEFLASLVERQGANPLALVQADLSRAWGAARTRWVEWPLTVRVGRIH